MHRQFGQQAVGLPLQADHVDRLIDQQGRFQQFVGDQLGHHVSDAHVQPPGSSRWSPPQRVLQFATNREDFIGIPKDGVAHLGQGEIATNLFEQLVPHRRLQPLQLGTDGRLSQQQAFGGPRHAAFAGDHPEIQQVVIVEPVHSPMLQESLSINQIDNSYL